MIKQLPKFLSTLLVLCLSFINFVNGQSVSNEGLEFWSVFPTHLPNPDRQGRLQLANISIFITGRSASSGTISVGSFSQKFTVVANTVTEIQVPRASAYINDFEGGKVLSNRAIHIVTDAGQPAVVVYAHIFAGQRSAASLILPIKALGQQYYSMNYAQGSRGGGQNFITLIASEANTKVFIKKGTTDLVPGGVTLTNIGDVYEYLSYDDLAGVSVSVDSTTSNCNRFAMFSGSSGTPINAPSCSPGSIDPLYQQNYPIESWGRTYGYIPFSMIPPNGTTAIERTLGNYIRVVAKDDNTNVQINGTTVATLNAGGVYSSPNPLSQPASISADKPICVAQFALTSACSDRSGGGSLGDPDMVILNPIEYSIKNITVYSSTRENITEQYINVLIKTASAPSFLVNGRAPATPFVSLAALPGYSYLQLSLNSYRTNNFNLTANDGFNAIAYGFGDVESYAYSAGTNLATTVTATVVDPVSNVSITSACVYDNYNLQLTLNVPTKKIVWTITPSNPATVITTLNPVAKDTTINAKPYYIYKIPKPGIFNKAGLYNINIVADLPPSTGGCTIGDQNYNFPFTVYSAPVAAFTMPANVCAGSPATFTDKSSDSSKTVKSWIWKFGDGTTSTLQNPTHTYTKPGIDTVSLTAISESGCQTTTQQLITVNNLPVASFTYTNSVFKNYSVFFKDASTIAAGNIIKWAWTFGDGSTATKTNNLTFEHAYAAAGTYQVTLIVTSDLGCQDTISQSVITKPAIKPDFKTPLVCSADLSAQFFDLTADAVSPGITLTYLWNFGDADATADNPNTSTDKNPTHRFGKPQVYQVTLTVTASDSSFASVTKSFQVNGSTPKAAFNIITSGNICSNQPIIFENQSTVDTGKITRIQWYFDYQNQPNVVLTDDSATAGERYVHQYEIFNMPATKTFTVRMIAYSGITCVSVIEKTITINAVPKVVFSALGSVCQEVSPFQITQAEDVSGAVGTGVYSGAGVTATGMFNPAAAGLGPHPIKYIFTTNSGCADSLTQTITVTPTPVIIFPKVIRFHEGEQVQLNPKISGKIVTYKWTPSVGLSNDHIANPIATPLGDITYRLTVTSTDSCTTTDTVAIRILKIPIIPNTFTPNSDGINDVWNIQNLDRYPDCIMDIYNRYGVRMFHSIGYGTAWDGRYQGQEVPVGTYYYVLNLNDGTKNYGGYVTVIR